MCGQKEVAMLSVFRMQKRISGPGGKEPGVNQERRTKGKGGSSRASWYLLWICNQN